MKYLVFFLVIILALSCETAIEPELDKPERLLVVDAWVNRKLETQKITIARSQPYFENSEPALISGAEVWIEDLNNGDVYNFSETEVAYIWEPGSEPFGKIGHEYRLIIEVEGSRYEATASLGAVPPVEYIEFNYYPADLFIDQDYYMAEFMAYDLPGRGNTYWIKAWKNGVYLGKPSELNMVYDGTFTASQATDGAAFILPVRRDMINPYDAVPGEENRIAPPYTIGDSLYVEIHSLDQLAYDFLWEVYFAISRPGGFAELFSMPLANAPTDLKKIHGEGEGNVAGFFNVAAVSSNGKKLTPELAQKAREN